MRDSINQREMSRRAAVLAACLFLSVGGAASGQSAAIDRDQDGLDDALEKRLAEHFFPKQRWYHKDEGCANRKADQIVVYRVWPEKPGDPGTINIIYAMLYGKDCGEAKSGIDGHNGDVEGLGYRLVKDPGCSVGYRLHKVKTRSHGGGEDVVMGDNEESKTLDTCEGVSELYIAQNKHGNYLSKSGCERGGFAQTDTCGKGWTRPATLLNAGEPQRHDGFTNDLDRYYDDEWVWDGKDRKNGKFCGGRKCDGCQKSCGLMCCPGFDAKSPGKVGNMLKSSKVLP
jgi:hypothetical protein